MKGDKNIVAVTGAEGFLGNNVCRKLIYSGYHVRGLNFNDPKALDGLNMEVMHGDIRDMNSIEALIEGADYVINLAAILTMDLSYQELVDTNVNGVRNIVDLCIKHKVKRFIHVSTIQSFQQSPLNEVLDESRPLVDDSAIDYDRSKADGDREVAKGVKQGLDAVVLMAGGLIGPNDFNPTVTGQLLIDYTKEPRPIPASGGYDWTDVRDVADAVVNAIHNGKSGEHYLLSGKFYTMVELTGHISKIIGKEVVKSKIPMWFIKGILPVITIVSKITKKPATFTKARLDSLFINQQISHEKARRELGYNPRTLEETLKHTYAWFRSKGYME